MARAKAPPYRDSTHPNSARAKALWQDPVYRAKTIAANAIKNKRRAEIGTRVGIPDGMRKHQAKWFWRQAKFEATLTMKKLDKAGVLDDADDQAREALHAALVVMRGPHQPKDKLAAARLVLDFTKAKPAQRQEITVTKAEEWLEAVVADAKREPNAAQADERADRGPEASA